MAKRLISSCILFFIVIFFCGCGAPKKLINLVDIAEVKMVKVGDIEVSGAGEPPPCALSDTDVNLSAHPAPIIPPLVLFIRLCLLHRFLP
jgi:hypothetical protein